MGRADAGVDRAGPVQTRKGDCARGAGVTAMMLWVRGELPSVGTGFRQKHRECANYHTTALISHASKVMLKILQARLQQYVNHELSDVQAGFRKGRGTRDQIANIRWIIKKAKRVPEKHLFLLY